MCVALEAAGLPPRISALIALLGKGKPYNTVEG